MSLTCDRSFAIMYSERAVTFAGDTLTADVTGELDGDAYQITLTSLEPEKLAMTLISGLR